MSRDLNTRRAEAAQISRENEVWSSPRLRAVVPLWLRTRLRFAEAVLAKVGRWKVECPVCGWRFRSFRPAGEPARQHARCARCGSLERHRFQWLYLNSLVHRLPASARILHFAPEACLSDRLRTLPDIQYVTGDLSHGGSDVSLNIERLPFSDHSFDVIICSHVLEHVQEDVVALKELFRLLRPRGCALIQVPYDTTRSVTYEDPAATSADERRQVFGQSDHVRIYGHDYVSRLEAAGFEVEVVTSSAETQEYPAALFGLQREPLNVCRRPAAVS